MIAIRKRKMTKSEKRKNLIILILLILGIFAYGKNYAILPSVVIEQKNGCVTRFEDDILATENACKCIVEIKERHLFIYYFSAEIESAREDELVTPEEFCIDFTPSNFEDKIYFSGNNGSQKYVNGFIDTTQKDGSLCVYDSNQIYMYIVFEYALED